MQKLYIGNETYISLIKAKKMLDTLLIEKGITYLHLDAEKINSNELIERISSISLFTNNRIIFLKRIYRNKDKDILIPFLLEYLQKNITDSFIIWEDQKISSVTKYVKYFKQNNLLEEYNKLSKNEFKKFAKEECSELSISLDSDLLQLLCEYTNFDTERFHNSLNKLKLLEKDKYTKEDIEEISENTLEHDIWKLLDEMNKGEGKPLTILNNLFDQGIDPLYIIPMISRNLRLISLTKYLVSENRKYGEIASLIKIPPFTLKPLVDTTQRYSWEKIKSKYLKLSSLDYNIKIGGIEPKLGLTLFCTTT